MTREEAIKLIDTHTVCFYNEIDSPTLQALHMAIEALTQDSRKVTQESDLIRRSDAALILSSEMYAEGHGTNLDDCVQEANAWMAAAPSAEAVHKPDYSYEAGMVRRLKEALSADRPTGEWLVGDAWPHNVYCSNCYATFAQEHWEVWEDGSLPRKFCPNCGAKMGGSNHD